MPVEVAAPKTTGGGGFTFADKVCAYWMAHMLAGAPPLAPAEGLLESLHFETRPDGWYLDDVLLTLRRGNDEIRAAVSIKSNVQFGASSAPGDFVRQIWEQYLHVGSDVFAVASDLLVLVTAPLPHALRMAADGLQQKLAGADPTNFVTRLAVPGWANELERLLFESFRRPSSVASAPASTDEDTTRLLKRVRLLEFDFDRPVSSAEQTAVELCRGVVATAELSDALNLWARLLEMASKQRPIAGHLPRAAVIAELRKDFNLTSSPEYRADWRRLSSVAADGAARVPDTIAGLVRIDRIQEVARLANAVGNGSVALLGESGTGKSALARTWAEAHARSGGVFLWFGGQSFDRRDFAEFERDLGLEHDLREVAPFFPGKTPVVVFDGLDGIFRPESYALVATLLRVLNAGSSQSEPLWRALVTCQTQEWRRVEECLRRAGVDCAKWTSETLNGPSLEELGAVFEKFAPLRGLLLDSKIRTLLRNVKVLDVLATRLSMDPSAVLGTWVGESSAAEWFWQSFVVEKPDGHQRAHFLSKMAQIQADELRSATPRDAFDSSDVATLGALERDRICRVVNEKITFEHDLLSDWSRLRLLFAHSEDLLRYLDARLTSPLWHRAVRLYAMHFLEHGDYAGWKSHVAAKGRIEEVLGDLFLDAAFVSSNAAVILEHVHGELIANDGYLLGRLLARFQVLATRPDPRLAALLRAEGMELPVSTRFRYPNWAYWPGLLGYVHRHKEQLCPLAPLQLADLMVVWLESAPPKTLLRNEAAEVALHLGTWVLDKQDTPGVYRAQGPIFRAVLDAASELPDDAAGILLRAVGRTPDRAADRKEERRSERLPPFVAPARLREPWPDGPRRRIPHGVRETILEAGALRPLVDVRPAIAREVALAALLEAPSERAIRQDGFAAMHLGFHSGLHWTPAFYTDGPFLLFLRTSFTEGLELIARCVDFASERWFRVDDEPASAAGVGGTAKSVPGVAVPLPSGAKRFIGDANVYGWSAGSGNAPDAVQAALMALEQYFYGRIEEGVSIEGEIQQVMERVRSAACLKVLIEIGKREKSLFGRSLLPLLAVPQIYHWDIAVSVHGRSVFGIGAPLRGDWFVKLASAFHGAPHRKEDLRNVLTRVLIDFPETRQFLSERASEWETTARSEPDTDSAQFLQQLANLARFENYQIAEKTDSGVVIVNVKEAERISAMAPELRRQMEKTELVQLPMKCRQWIDDGRKLSEGELESLWNVISRIPSRLGLSREAHGAQAGKSLPLVTRALRWLRKALSLRVDQATAETPATEDDELNLLPAALAGGIAVFVRVHPEWLRKFPDRKQWCAERLREIIETPPGIAPWDMPTSISDWTWDAFASEAVPVLWSERVGDPLLLGLAAQLVFAPHNLSVRTLFARCAEQRTGLGDRFEHLRRLLFEWSSVRPVAYRAGELMHSPDAAVRALRVAHRIAKWKARRIRDFVRGRMRGVTTPWSSMDVGQRLRADLQIPPWAWEPFDLDLVRAAHEWAPRNEDFADAADREAWAEFWLDALADVLPRRTLPIGRNELPRDDFPVENERWLLSRVADALLSEEDAPERLYERVLDLPSHAHKWTAEFLREYHRGALRRPTIPRKYVEITVRMANSAFSRVAEDRKRDPWPFYEEVWEALLGIDGYTQHLWEKRHEAVVAELLDVFEKWASLRWTVSAHIRSFSTWLARDAARPARVRALLWMQRALHNDAGEWLLDRDEDGAEALSRFLAVLWQQEEARVRSSGEPFVAFRELLTALAAHQDATAMELLARIGGSA